MRRRLSVVLILLAVAGCSDRIDSEPRDNIDVSLRSSCGSTVGCTSAAEPSSSILGR
jgi:hypothetical protein